MPPMNPRPPPRLKRYSDLLIALATLPDCKAAPNAALLISCRKFELFDNAARAALFFASTCSAAVLFASAEKALGLAEIAAIAAPLLCSADATEALSLPSALSDASDAAALNFEAAMAASASADPDRAKFANADGFFAIRLAAA